MGLVFAIAAAIRGFAAIQLPLDHDETIYLRGAQRVAAALRAGDMAALTEDPISPEHPPLSKFALGVGLLTAPPHPPVDVDPNFSPPRDLLAAARMVNAGLGVATAAALAIVSPMAGALLAISGLHIRYTTEVLLEALPCLASLLMVMAYSRWRGGRRRRWLLISAVLLGATAAGKYTYAVAGVAVAVDWVIEMIRRPRAARRAELQAFALWAAVSVAAFLCFDPVLWPSPVNRLLDTLTFHRAIAAAAANASYYSTAQPLVWWVSPHLTRLVSSAIEPNAALFALGCVGIVPLFRARRVAGIWLVLAVLVTLAYTNKLPQYLLIGVAPLCLASEAGGRWLLGWVGRRVPPKLADAPPALLGVAGLAIGLWTGGNPFVADPAYDQGRGLIAARMASDEVALFAAGNPSIALARARQVNMVWDWADTRGLKPGDLTIDYEIGAGWLDHALAGQKGAWLLIYQDEFADPSGTLRALLQRQAHALSSDLSVDLGRGFRLDHFRFDQPYQQSPPIDAFTSAIQTGAVVIEPDYGSQVGLSSAGCLALNVIPAATPGRQRIEVGCLWRSQPYIPLPWDTQISARARDASGALLGQVDGLIARGGFPSRRFEGNFPGFYTLEVADTPPGRPLAIQVFAYGQGREYSPRITIQPR